MAPMTPDPTILKTPAELALWWRGVAADHREIASRCAGHDRGQHAHSVRYAEMYDQMAEQLERVLRGLTPIDMDPDL